MPGVPCPVACAPQGLAQCPAQQALGKSLLSERMAQVGWAPCGVLCGSDVMVAVPSTGYRWAPHRAPAPHLG